MVLQVALTLWRLPYLFHISDMCPKLGRTLSQTLVLELSHGDHHSPRRPYALERSLALTSDRVRARAPYPHRALVPGAANRFVLQHDAGAFAETSSGALFPRHAFGRGG